MAENKHTPALDRRKALGLVAGALGAGTVVAGGATIAAVTRAHGASEPDADLIALCQRAVAAELADTEADMAEDNRRSEYWEREPKIPEAVRQTGRDVMDFGGGYGRPHRTDKENPTRVYFRPDHIDLLRTADWTSVYVSENGGVRRLDPRKQARADEIVAAWDAWQAECDRVRNEVGLTAAEERSIAASEAWDALQEEVLAAKATTLPAFWRRRPSSARCTRRMGTRISRKSCARAAMPLSGSPTASCATSSRSTGASRSLDQVMSP